MKSDNENNEPITLGVLKKEKSSKPVFVIFCFILLLGTCFGLPYIKDYINNNNDSFSVLVRQILNSFTQDEEPAPEPETPTEDRQLLNKTGIVSYQSIKLTNFNLEGNKISFDMSSNTDFNLDEHKLFLEIYGAKNLLTRVKLTGKITKEMTSVNASLYKLTINTGENYYGKIVNMTLDDYPEATSANTLTCSLNNKTYTYSFDNNTLKTIETTFTNNNTSDITEYMNSFNTYQELSTRLTNKNIESKTEETDNGFVFKAKIEPTENIRETLSDDYDYNYFYKDAPLKEVSYDMLTKGFDCK